MFSKETRSRYRRIFCEAVLFSVLALCSAGLSAVVSASFSAGTLDSACCSFELVSLRGFVLGLGPLILCLSCLPDNQRHRHARITVCAVASGLLTVPCVAVSGLLPHRHPWLPIQFVLQTLLFLPVLVLVFSSAARDGSRWFLGGVRCKLFPAAWLVCVLVFLTVWNLRSDRLWLTRLLDSVLLLETYIANPASRDRVVNSPSFPTWRTASKEHGALLDCRVVTDLEDGRGGLLTYTNQPNVVLNIAASELTVWERCVSHSCFESLVFVDQETAARKPLSRSALIALGGNHGQAENADWGVSGSSPDLRLNDSAGERH